MTEVVASSRFVIDGKMKNSELATSTSAYADELCRRGQQEAAKILRELSGSASTMTHEMELVDRLIAILEKRLIDNSYSVMIQGDGGTRDGVSFNVWSSSVVVNAADAPPPSTSGFSQHAKAAGERAGRRVAAEQFCPSKQPSRDANAAAWQAFTAERMRPEMARLRDTGDLNPFVAASASLSVTWRDMTPAEKLPYEAAALKANKAKSQARVAHDLDKKDWSSKQGSSLKES
jgi:hypothetical protein